ncbi:MAG: GrpB family protein [Clostridiaceae bacterium]
MTLSRTLPIFVVPYDPAWPRLFSIEKERIDAVIHQYVSSIEHVGSTAVPGLAAKPVIDILIGVKHLFEAAFFIPPLLTLGYVYIPELELDLPERRYLQKISAGAHTHHLHLVEPDTSFYIDHLRFRDLLCLHPELASEYATLKLALAKKYRYDRAAYTDAKSNFIQRVLILPD